MNNNDYDEIRKALNHLDANDRDFWVKMGAAIKDELGDNGFELWDEWSQQSDNYKANDAKSVWKSLKSGHIHIATLFYHAREHGYRPDKPYTPPSPDEMAKRAAESAAKRRAEQERIAQAHAKAEKTAYGIWKNANPASLNHAYAQNKGLNAESLQGIRQNEYQGKKQLIIPLYADKKLVNIQTIDEQGNKKFLNGGQKQGAYTIIGDFKQNQQGIILAEGFATAASVHQATGKPVVVAFDAGNLKAVSEKLQKVLPEQVPVYFAADNDVSQTGLKKAQAAAEIWGERAKIMLPEFTPQHIQQYQQQFSKEKMPSDFNDLHQLAGIEAVRNTFGMPTPEIKQPEAKPEMSREELFQNNYWRVSNGYDPLPEHNPPKENEMPKKTFELGQAVKHENPHLQEAYLVVGKRQDGTYLLMSDEPIREPNPIHRETLQEWETTTLAAYTNRLVYENQNVDKAYAKFEQESQKYQDYDLISKEQFYQAFGKTIEREQTTPEMPLTMNNDKSQNQDFDYHDFDFEQLSTEPPTQTAVSDTAVLSSPAQEHELPPPETSWKMSSSEPMPQENTAMKLNIIPKNFEHDPASQAVQDKVMKQAMDYPQELIDTYKDIPNTFEGRYIASDMMKEVFEDFNQSPAHRNQFNNAVHNTAASLAAEHFQQMLNQPIKDGRDTVVFLTGCPGAGKTTSVMNNGHLDKSTHVVFEGQLANAQQSAATVDKIQQALDKGYKVEIIAVNPLPEQALENTFKRYYDPNDGRGAPISTMARIQGNTYDGLNYLHQRFGDKINLTIVDKPQGNQNAIKYTGWQHLDVLKSHGTEQTINQRLENHLLQHFKQGNIDYECFKQSAGTTERAQQLIASMDRSIHQEQQPYGDGRSVSPRSSETRDLRSENSSSNISSESSRISSPQKSSESGLNPTLQPENITATSKSDVAEHHAPNSIEYDGTRQTIDPQKPHSQQENHRETELNTIEYSGLQQKQYQVKQPENPLPQSTTQKQAILDFNYEIPEHLKSRMVAVDTQRFRVANYEMGAHLLRYTAADNAQTVLFEDKGKTIQTARDDKQTIQDMLAVAQAKGWDSINISGSKEFKQQMWLEAESRGIATKGYKPSPEDLAVLEKRRAERSTNSIAEAERLKQQSATPEQVGSHNKTIPTEAIKAADNVQAQAKEQYQHKFNSLDTTQQAKATFYEKIGLAILERLPEQSREKAMQHFYDNQAEKIHDGKFHAPDPMRERESPQQEPKSQHTAHDDWEVER